MQPEHSRELWEVMRFHGYACSGVTIGDRAAPVARTHMGSDRS
jgi:formylmethanofuran dehydrogenase subunit E